MPTVEENPVTVIESGIDYITAVSTDPVRRQLLRDVARRILEIELAGGCDVTPWKFSGYRGWSAGSVSYGVRWDSVCARLSSHLADDHWQELYPLATNVSRLDLQVTVSFGCDVAPILSRLRRQVHKCKNKVGRRPNYHMHVERQGPTALNIGRRSSDVYLRAYDKGAESRLDYYRGCLRFEAELKGAMSRCYAATISREVQGHSCVRNLVRTLFADRGVNLPGASAAFHLTRGPRPEPKVYDLRGQALKASCKLINASIVDGKPEIARGYVESLQNYLESMLSSGAVIRPLDFRKGCSNGNNSSND